LESSPLLTPSVLSKKQEKLLSDLNCVISQVGIDLHINPVGGWGGFPWAVDIEHDEQGNLVGIGICENTFCGYFTSIPKYLKDLLEVTQIIAHNGVSDLECLRMWGINVRDEQLVWDTMLIGHIIDSSGKDYSLKGMAKRELGISYPSYDDIVGKRGLKAERITLDKQPMELVAKYNAIDTFVTYSIYEKQRKVLGNVY
jgi:DNA polymerase I-like protein with 3'-5' exonuclease and polymerase domains